MFIVAILWLDLNADSWASSLEVRANVRVDLTMLDKSELLAPSGDYRISQFGKDLAASARPSVYDFVVIGNNLGTGYEYARRIPQEMRSRTLIVWNSSSVRNEQPYVELGFEHFALRSATTETLLNLLDAGIEFTNLTDDTPENRDIVRTVLQRTRRNPLDDRSLEEVAAELGVELPALAQAAN